LTDGAPNSTKDSMAQIIMNTSLSNNNKYTFSVKPSGTGVLISPALQSGLFENETGGWEYIGEYSKKLLDPAMNPGNMKIKTAVVGFGASFEGILKNADGSYNCESVKDSNPDAYNACQWGGSEFGNGGFYYANNPDDIKNSIINFVNNVTVSFTPSSLGSISVPRDPLDQTRVMTTGFFPMVMPMEDTSIRNWVGNLKKYKILGGTLKDNSNNAIYTTQNGQQVINSSAKDLWSNAATGADNSLINSGGAWNQIPVPSTLNITGEPSNASSQRRVFTIDGSSLRQITKENLATDYSGTTPVALNNVSINQRYALLNYLGYQTTFPPATDATLTSTQIATMAVIPTNPYRYLGGVVHSTPLVVTKSATLSSGANSVTSRSEYVVYGSMDGGLHVVDASTGEEKSVFVPKEILDHQYDTLSGQNSKGLSGLTGMVYGVDAPWAADNTFKVVSTSSGKTTTTKYEANRMNIYGGLRMGGKAIYGLDIGTPSTPKLKFHITPSTSGFDRMAQIWSKPTLAQIRIQGKTKRVLIFGGGYDPDTYEIAGLTTEPSSSKGNALYIVDADNGDLIWQTSENVSASNTASPNSDIKYSVVAQPVAMDYDADGLADMIYFADLGGQIFRIDLNNATQISTTVTTNPAVRVRRIANLREGSGSNLFVPRFYDRLTTAVFNGDNGRFVLVTAGSGNRSFPLESSKGQNKIYGIFDFDAASNGLEKTNYANYDVEATSSNVVNRGDLGKTATTISWGGGNIKNDQIRSNLSKGGIYRGWSFNLKSVSDSTSNYYSKSFEESQLVSSDLYVNLYDPKATLSGVVNACGGGIQGISTTHRICAPYGDCAAYVKQSYQGIIGPSLGAVSDSSDRTSSLVGPVGATQEACIGKCSSNNSSLTDQTLGQYSQSRKIKPTRWFEW
jgi:type IV pilus assembly protein PilY1